MNSDTPVAPVDKKYSLRKAGRAIARVFETVVYRSPVEKPSSVNHLKRARLYRWLTFGLALFGAIFVQFYGIYHDPDLDQDIESSTSISAATPLVVPPLEQSPVSGQAPQTIQQTQSTVTPSEPNRDSDKRSAQSRPRGAILRYFFATTVSIPHLVYLILVCGLLVWSRPLPMLRFNDMLYPFLLTLAYLLHAAESYFVMTKDPTRVRLFEYGSYIAFIALYLCWFLRDYFERKRDKYSRNKVKHVKRFWMRWELVFAALLLFDLLLLAVTERSMISWLNPTLGANFTTKDASVITCLCLYYYSQSNYRTFLHEKYQTIYTPYLRHNKVLRWTIPTPITLEETAHVLDFGCGDGSRLLQFFNHNRIATESLSIVGHDTDSEWEGAFEETLQKASLSVRFCSVYNDIPREPYDLIYLSHVLYDVDSVQMAVKCIREHGKSALIVVRGCSPNSFFASSSLVQMKRLWRPPVSYLWNTVHLDHLARELKLERLNSVVRGQPDQIIKQQYSLDKTSIKDAGDLLDYLYQRDAEEIAVELMKASREIGGINSIYNDDLVYLYKRSV